MRSLRAVVVIALGAALALPGVAGAQNTSAQPTLLPPTQTNNPLTPGFPQPSGSTPSTTTPTPTITTSATSGSGNGFSGSSAIIIALGAIVVLGGISFFIWHDARRRAPTRHRTAAALAEQGRRKGSKQRAKPRKLSAAERRRRKRGRAR
jgi:hypothetical protein